MNNKSTWDDISKYWKRIAAVITAVGVITTFLTNIIHTPLDKTLIVTSCVGLTLLIISFYVDRQTFYIRNEIEANRTDFDNKLLNHKKESSEVFSSFTSSLFELKEMLTETRRDTLRIQLLMVMENQPNNIDTVLKLAEKYFVDLKGDWYMTSEFTKWAKEHNVIIPFNIISHNSEED